MVKLAIRAAGKPSRITITVEPQDLGHVLARLYNRLFIPNKSGWLGRRTEIELDWIENLVFDNSKGEVQRKLNVVRQIGQLFNGALIVNDLDMASFTVDVSQFEGREKGVRKVVSNSIKGAAHSRGISCTRATSQAQTNRALPVQKRGKEHTR